MASTYRMGYNLGSGRKPDEPETRPPSKFQFVVPTISVIVLVAGMIADALVAAKCV